MSWEPRLGLSDSPDVVLFEGMAFERQVSAPAWSSLVSVDTMLRIAIPVSGNLLVC
jgi:hypothetical protein